MIATLSHLFLFLSIGLVMSADTWMAMWVGFELNLLSFVSIMYSVKNVMTSESMMKYFLIQALGSLTFLLAVLSGSIFIASGGVLLGVLSMAMVLKLGCAPFHQWFPGVVEGMSWSSVGVLMILQKLPALTVLLQGCSLMFIWVVALMSSLVGGAGGFNQSLLRKLLAYSSITHMGWMILLLGQRLIFWLYYVVYASILLGLLIAFAGAQIFTVSGLVSSKKALLTYLALLSMGGLPPLLGFLPKLVALGVLLSYHPFAVLVLILGSLLNLGYYLRMTLKGLVLGAWGSMKGEMSSLNTGAWNMVSLLMLFPLIIMLV